MVRWLLIEAVHHAVRGDSALRQHYQRLKFRRGHAVAKVAIARKLAVRLSLQALTLFDCLGTARKRALAFVDA